MAQQTPLENRISATVKQLWSKSRFDILVLIGAVLTLFVGLGTEPWWTLNGTTNARLLNLEISPFLARINAVGLPATVPYANILGSLTRTLALVGFVAFFAASIRPTAWWRNLAIYFGLSSLAELYLSFLLMFYWTETAFAGAYGVVPPYFGTATLPINMIGLDYGYYPFPQVTASFNFAYYLGFLTVGLVFARALIKLLHDRAFQLFSALLPNGVGIHSIRLSPPYQQVWFSTGDEQYNPMWKYIGGVGDDQLLLSFEKLFETVEPGGSISVIVPTDATILSEKLEKLMPQIGFIVGETKLVNDDQDKFETELSFTRPSLEQTQISNPPTTEPEISVEPPSVDSTSTPMTPDVGAEPPLIQEPTAPTQAGSQEQASEPMLEIVQRESPRGQKVTRLERAMLRSAIRAITEHHQSVPYRELLNEVYMDLVDQKVEFDSSRQIETTLLNHNGQEIVLVEESDGPGGRDVKKWAIGRQKLRSESRRIPVLNRVKAITPKITSIRKIIRRPRKSGYKRKSGDRDDSADQSSDN